MLGIREKQLQILKYYPVWFVLVFIRFSLEIFQFRNNDNHNF